MADNEQQVSVSRVIDAPPEDIFAVLTDPAQHPVIDGSGTVKADRLGRRAARSWARSSA